MEANGRAATCAGEFFDSGGTNVLFGQYQNNLDQVYTICPDDPGRRIRLTFTQFRVVDEDVLCFYDGDNMNAPLLSCWDDKVSQGGLDAIFNNNFDSCDFKQSIL